MTAFHKEGLDPYIHSSWAVSLVSLLLCENTSIPSIYFQNAKQLTIIAKGPTISLLSYISPLPDICQFYVRGLGMPVIVLRHENDVNFPTGPFLCNVDCKAAGNSCTNANTSHNLQKLLPCSSTQLSVVPWRVIDREKKNDVIFPTGL